MENNNNEKHPGQEPRFDEYFRMSEREKDLAIERSVLRLQNRLRHILHLIEIERNSSAKPARDAKPGDHPRNNGN